MSVMQESAAVQNKLDTKKTMIQQSLLISSNARFTRD